MKVEFGENQQNDLKELKDELEHYGVPGMKWGIRKDKKRSSITVGSRSASNPARQRMVKREEERSKKRAERKTQKEALAKVKAEKKRKDILNNPSKLYKHRREFSQEEIEKALKQFEWEKKISNYSMDRMKKGADYINNIFLYTNNAINVYNNAARFLNAFKDEDEKPLPYIPAANTKKKQSNSQSGKKKYEDQDKKDDD